MMNKHYPVYFPIGGKKLESDMQPLDDLCINDNNKDMSIKLGK